MGNFKCIYHRKIWRFIASFWLLLCCSQVANATSFYWASSEPDPNHFDSAAAACDYWFGRTNPNVTVLQKMASSMDRVSDTEVLCRFTYDTKPEMIAQYGYLRSDINLRVFRFGTTCPEGSTWNSETLRCDAPEPDKCEATKGQEVAHAHKFADVVDGKLTNYKQPPAALCKGSCAYGSPATTGDGYRFVNGDPAGLWQNYSYLGTGQACEEDANNPSPDAPSDNKPSSSKSNECTNKVTDAEGRVHYSCLATDSKTEPGKFSCGTANGQLVCTTKKPPPSKVDSEKKTEVTETPGGDGSTTTTTTTTTTVTSCTGVNSCTTTTTVNNGTSKTNADGSDGGSSSDCTGPGCKNGDGTGEKGEDDKEDEEEEKKEVSGEGACDVQLSCSGDAIQCAMVRQQKTQRCEDEKFRTIDSDKVQETQAGIEGAFTGDQYSPIKPDGEDGSLDLSTMIDTSRHFSAACPAVPDWNVPWLENTSVRVPVSDVIAQLCPYLVWFGYFVVAFAMRAAAEIIARGLS